MNRKLNKLEEGLERLLLQKKYSDLNKAEKEYVANYLVVEEYENHRQALLKSQTLFKEHRTIADPAIKTNLLHALKSEPSSNQLQAIAKYPISLWKVVAAAAVLFFIIRFFDEEPTIIPVEPQIVYVHKTDTIYKEREIIKIVEKETKKRSNLISSNKQRSNKLNKTKAANKKQLAKRSEKKLLNISSSPLILDTQEVEKLLTDMEQTPSNGRSAADEQALMDLFVEIN